MLLWDSHTRHHFPEFLFKIENWIFCEIEDTGRSIGLHNSCPCSTIESSAFFSQRWSLRYRMVPPISMNLSGQNIAALACALFVWVTIKGFSMLLMSLGQRQWVYSSIFSSTVACFGSAPPASVLIITYFSTRQRLHLVYFLRLAWCSANFNVIQLNPGFFRNLQQPQIGWSLL